MSNIQKVNISLLKNYKNRFNNEKNNFKNNTYNTFSSSYLKTCSDYNIQKMGNILSSLFNDLNNSYEKIDKWWEDYNKNIESLENYLSGQGGLGSITESSVRGFISSKLDLLEEYKETNEANFKRISTSSRFTMDTVVNNFSSLFVDYIDTNEKVEISLKERATKISECTKTDVSIDITNSIINEASEKNNLRIYGEYIEKFIGVLSKPLTDKYNNTKAVIDNNINIDNEFIKDMLTTVVVLGSIFNGKGRKEQEEEKELWEIGLEKANEIKDDIFKFGKDVWDSGVEYTSNLKKDIDKNLTNLKDVFINHVVQVNEIQMQQFEYEQEVAMQTAAFLGNATTSLGDFILQSQLNSIEADIAEAEQSMATSATMMTTGLSFLEELGNKGEWLLDSTIKLGAMYADGQTFNQYISGQLTKEQYESFTPYSEQVKEFTNKNYVSGFFNNMYDNTSFGQYLKNNTINFEDTRNIGKTTMATIETGAVSIFEGGLQLGEDLLDASMILGAYKADADYYNNFSNYIVDPDAYLNHIATIETVKPIIEEEHVKNAFDDMYENTDYGKSLKENTYGFDNVRTVTSGISYTVGIMAISGGNPLAAAGVAGTAGFGKGTEEAWNNGASTNEGAAYGLATGFWEGIQYYAGGKIGADNGWGTQIANSIGKKIPILTSSPWSKQALTSTIRIGLDSVDGGIEGGVQPLLRLIYENGYYDKDGVYREFTSDQNLWNRYCELFDDNGGWSYVATNAAIGAGSSAIGEIFDMSKLFKSEDIKNIDVETKAEVEVDNVSKKQIEQSIDSINNKSKLTFADLKYTPSNLVLFLPESVKSFFRRFVYTDTALIKNIDETILNRDLYHFSEHVDEILASGYVEASGKFRSYGRPKSFFFAGVPDVGAYAGNLNDIPLKTTAVRIEAPVELIRDPKLKVRKLENEVITYNGNLDLTDKKATKEYFCLFKENNELVYKSVSEDFYNNYENTIEGKYISDFVKNKKNVYTIMTDHFCEISKRNTQANIDFATSKISSLFDSLKTDPQLSLAGTGATVSVSRFDEILENIDDKFEMNTNTKFIDNDSNTINYFESKKEADILAEKIRKMDIPFMDKYKIDSSYESYKKGIADIYSSSSSTGKTVLSNDVDVVALSGISINSKLKESMKIMDEFGTKNKVDNYGKKALENYVKTGSIYQTIDGKTISYIPRENGVREFIASLDPRDVQKYLEFDDIDGKIIQLDNDIGDLKNSLEMPKTVNLNEKAPFLTKFTNASKDDFAGAQQSCIEKFKKLLKNSDDKYEIKLLEDTIHKYYPNMSKKETLQFLERLNAHGCTYVAMSSSIFEQLDYNADLFKKMFGFDMYLPNGKLNHNQLILDMFSDMSTMVEIDYDKVITTNYKSWSEAFQKTFNIDPTTLDNPYNHSLEELSSFKIHEFSKLSNKKMSITTDDLGNISVSIYNNSEIKNKMIGTPNEIVKKLLGIDVNINSDKELLEILNKNGIKSNISIGMNAGKDGSKIFSSNSGAWINKYLKNKGIDLQIDISKMNSSYYELNDFLNILKNKHSNGYSIEVSALIGKVISMTNGTKYGWETLTGEKTGHAMIFRGITENNEIIVSSWGKHYKIPVEFIDNLDFNLIKIKDSNSTSNFVVESDSLIKNSDFDSKSKNSKINNIENLNSSKPTLLANFEKYKEKMLNIFNLDYDSDIVDKVYIDTFQRVLQRDNVSNKSVINIIENLENIKRINPKFSFSWTESGSGFWGPFNALCMNKKTMEAGTDVAEMTVLHELGHALLHTTEGNPNKSWILTQTDEMIQLLDSARNNIKNNSENFYSVLRDSNKVYNKSFNETVSWYNGIREEQKNKISEMIDNLYVNNDINELENISKSAVKLNQVQEILESSGMTTSDIEKIVSNPNLMKEIAITENAINMQVSHQERLMSDFSIYGDERKMSSMLNSVTQSIDSITLDNGEVLNYSYGHSNQYWNKNGTPDLLSYDELFADFFALSAAGRTEALEKFRLVVGDELYNSLNNQIDKISKTLTNQ